MPKERPSWRPSSRSGSWTWTYYTTQIPARWWTGSQIIAKALWHQGIRVVFGLVGYPVFNISQACIDIGMQFYGLRNEQATSYAASAHGYLTGKPAVLVVVPGPGVVHALAGMANSTESGWPLLVIGGGNPTFLHSMGGFQEMDQISATKPFVKLAVTPPSILDIPRIIEKAYRVALYGRPGATFIDVVSASEVELGTPCPPPPRPLADPSSIAAVVKLLLSAKSPLIVVGKGAQYSQAETPVRQLVDLLECPFLPTPMGKGLVSDTHPMNISAARSAALAGADVGKRDIPFALLPELMSNPALILGGRANWILHHFQPPKWNRNVKIIQIDIEAEELHSNVTASVAICGDLRAVCEQLVNTLRQNHASMLPLKNIDPWKDKLKAIMQKASTSLAAKAASDDLPMTYYRVFGDIKKMLPEDHVMVTEGSLTMDIGRSFFEAYHPRSRLDAGTYATMGVGLGFAMAAAVHYPNRRVIAIEGDAAFGFSGMEVEAMARYRLNIIIVIINNNGNGGGFDEKKYKTFETSKIPATVLLPDTRYEKMADMVGSKGWYVQTPQQLQSALEAALADRTLCPAIINVAIEPGFNMPSTFTWLKPPREAAKL